ncbi:hypothetical protein CEXT_239441 [Caerostris extrusa]|uniref:Uncharacterized protein n=1 Tax=Caerostris extrusa TaxID=172846 RepID=A0AAV4XEI7_CAEEX|nr:hypothetical protein CEXT_239441 [Caerostris extrusa]
MHPSQYHVFPSRFTLCRRPLVIPILIPSKGITGMNVSAHGHQLPHSRSRFLPYHPPSLSVVLRKSSFYPCALDCYYHKTTAIVNRIVGLQ